MGTIVTMDLPTEEELKVAMQAAILDGGRLQRATARDEPIRSSEVIKMEIDKIHRNVDYPHTRAMLNASFSAGLELGMRISYQRAIK